MTGTGPLDKGLANTVDAAIEAGSEAASPVLARLLAAVASDPGRTALRFMGRATTYRDLGLKVEERANGLRHLGLGPGARLGVLLPNCPALVTYVFAAYAIGATVVLLDPEAADAELAATVQAARVRVLVTCDLAAVQAKGLALAQQGLLDRVVVVAFASQLPLAAAARLRLFSAHRVARPPGPSVPMVTGERELLGDLGVAAVVAAGPTPRPATLDDVAMVTGPVAGDGIPAATLTHAALAANLAQMLAALPELTQGKERILAAVPLYRPLAFNLAVHAAIARTSELIIPEDLARGSMAAALRHGPPTVMIAAPPVLEAMLAAEALRTPAFGTLRFALTVGGTASKRLHAAFAAMTPAPLLQSYGVATAATMAAVTSQNDERGPLAGHCLAATRAVVRDLADPTRDVPRGERGELFVSGPQFGVGAAGGGFLRTGDLGLIDPAGRLVVVDRIEDLIVAAGYMIYASRIEEALLEHAHVADAAVIGVGDGRRGNAPKAFVVLKRGVAVTERDLRLHLAARISKIEMPADIDFCTSLPRTAFGFVCKAALRKQEAARR